MTGRPLGKRATLRRPAESSTFERGSTVALSSPGDRARYVMAVTKDPGNPFLVGGTISTQSSIYWPSVIKARGLLGTPLDDYYMYDSTDHSNGAGGIRLRTAPTPLGPWTDRGFVFVDTVQGNQTETPNVIVDPVNGRLNMYYQQNGLGIEQATALATSPLSGDGTAWTRIGPAVIMSTAIDWPGGEHTGYFKPFLIHNRWYGYHLLGGGGYPHFGISHSYDGVNWTIDPRPLGYGLHLTTGLANRRIEWNSVDVVFWRGRHWLVGMLSNFVAGVTSKNAIPMIAPLSSNMRQILGPPQQLFALDSAWETPNLRSINCMTDQGRLYVYYQCDSSFGVAYTEG